MRGRFRSVEESADMLYTKSMGSMAMQQFPLFAERQ